MQEAWRQNPGSPLYWEDRKRAFALIREVEEAKEQSELSENSSNYMYLYAAVGRNATAMGILIAQGRSDFYKTCEREFEYEREIDLELEYMEKLIEREEELAYEIWNDTINWRQGEKLWSNSAKDKVVSYFEGEASCDVGVYRREKDGNPCWAVAVTRSFNDDHHDEYEDYVINVDSAEEGIKLAEELFTGLSSRVNSLMEAVDERSQAYEDRLIAEAERSYAKAEPLQ